MLARDGPGPFGSSMNYLEFNWVSKENLNIYIYTSASLNEFQFHLELLIDAGLDARPFKKNLWAEEHSTCVITSKRSMIVSEQQELLRVSHPRRGKLFSRIATYHIKNTWSLDVSRRLETLQNHTVAISTPLGRDHDPVDETTEQTVHTMQISPLQIPTIEHLHLTNRACLDDTTWALMPIPWWWAGKPPKRACG